MMQLYLLGWEYHQSCRPFYFCFFHEDDLQLGTVHVCTGIFLTLANHIMCSKLFDVDFVHLASDSLNMSTYFYYKKLVMSLSLTLRTYVFVDLHIFCGGKTFITTFNFPGERDVNFHYTGISLFA